MYLKLLKLKTKQLKRVETTAKKNKSKKSSGASRSVRSMTACDNTDLATKFEYNQMKDSLRSPYVPYPLLVPYYNPYIVKRFGAA